MKRLHAITLALVTLPSLFSLSARGDKPTQYFCSVDAATGFYFENGKWGAATFKADEKWLLKEVDATDQRRDWRAGDKIWELTEVGTSFPQGLCSDGYINLDGKRERMGVVSCEGLYEMKFNKKSLRFLMSYFAGYVDGIDNNENTPVLSIGKCSPL